MFMRHENFWKMEKTTTELNVYLWNQNFDRKNYLVKYALNKQNMQ